MSKPENRLSNWCRHLIVAYVSLVESERRYTVKGGAISKLVSPPLETCVDECEAEGYAAGAEGKNREEDTPSQELVQLIAGVQPSLPGEALVPSTLPRKVQDNIYTVKLEQFCNIFRVDTTLERKSQKERSAGENSYVHVHVSTCEVSAMYSTLLRPL